MAITAPTKTTDPQFSGFLTPELAAPIFEKAARVSVVQSLTQRVPLSPNGKKIPVVTEKMQAGWVAEGAQKPASKAGVGLKTISPEKIAAIAVVSSEVVRANPGSYMNLLRPQIAEAFAKAFDRAALYDLGPDGTGTGPFDTSLAQTTKAASLIPPADKTVHNQIVAGLRLLVTDEDEDKDYELNGFAFDSLVEPEFLDAVDGNGRPIYIETPLTETTRVNARPGRLIGRETFMNRGIKAPTPTTPSTSYTVGFGGDWSEAVWGAVGGISYDVSTQATVTINGALVSLWENNLVAIRAEAEYGWLVNDPEAFVEYQLVTPA